MYRGHNILIITERLFTVGGHYSLLWPEATALKISFDQENLVNTQSLVIINIVLLLLYITVSVYFNKKTSTASHRADIFRLEYMSKATPFPSLNKITSIYTLITGPFFPLLYLQI